MTAMRGAQSASVCMIPIRTQSLARRACNDHLLSKSYSLLIVQNVGHLDAVSLALRISGFAKRSWRGGYRDGDFLSEGGEDFATGRA